MGSAATFPTRIPGAAAPGTTPATPLPGQLTARSWQSADLLTFLREELPAAADLPRVVVLDNASMHHSHVIQEAQSELEDRGIQLWYLPPYAPELNDIERIFRTVKHEAMPVRSFTDVPALIAAVQAGFTLIRDRLLSQDLSMPDA